MQTSDEIWQDIESLRARYEALGIGETVDHDKFHLYSIITHSTAIEGSTLTEEETQLLFDNGATAGGKPLVHHLMNEDLRKAYVWACGEAGIHTPVTPAFLRKMNSIVMRSTGSEYNVMGGSFDSREGDFRLCGVTAGVGGRSYVNYTKVPLLVDRLCDYVNGKMSEVCKLREKYELSFVAHLNLATIHPWVDGNGRTSRLLMNYLQFRLSLIPCKIFNDDKAEYISALRESQEKESPIPFLTFMASQLRKSLSTEIANFEAANEKESGLLV